MCLIGRDRTLVEASRGLTARAGALASRGDRRAETSVQRVAGAISALAAMVALADASSLLCRRLTLHGEAVMP
jgi:hypothetical protein